MNCPRCGYELTHLRNYYLVEELYDFSLGEKMRVQYTHIDTSRTFECGHYGCPNCRVELTLHEYEAKLILEDKITSEMGQRFAEIALAGKEEK